MDQGKYFQWCYVCYFGIEAGMRIWITLSFIFIDSLLSLLLEFWPAAVIALGLFTGIRQLTPEPAASMLSQFFDQQNRRKLYLTGLLPKDSASTPPWHSLQTKGPNIPASSLMLYHNDLTFSWFWTEAVFCGNRNQ